MLVLGETCQTMGVSRCVEFFLGLPLKRKEKKRKKPGKKKLEGVW